MFARELANAFQQSSRGWLFVETASTQELWIYDLRTNQHFTLKENTLRYEDLEDFVTCYRPKSSGKPKETDQFHRFTYDELMARDKASLDIFWLRDDSLDDVDNRPAPSVIAAEIIEDLEAALAEFAQVADSLSADSHSSTEGSRLLPKQLEGGIARVERVGSRTRRGGSLGIGPLISIVASAAMWIRDVDFPEALIDAHRAGRLVVFVGAGASRALPSNLPDFRKLTADIAGEANVTISDAQLEQPDVLLGELEERHHVDVHVRVAALIGTQSSQPNKLHEAIVALSAGSHPARIVTTNYDLHLSTTVSARGLSMTEYMAPALPMGDDFTGLVYLHGCVRQDPHALVVTDADFGRAYLRDAWATRFLERMFASYTVLFVGYSHNDVVMSYLARALGPASARFVLTSEPDATHWRRLRIRPVGYRSTGSSHSLLAEAVAGWASWASMGLLDHRQRVAQLVAAPPSQVPEDASYLEAVVADSEQVRFFSEHARGEPWLTWVSGEPEFQRLFDPSATPTECTRPLAYWLGEQYVMEEDLTAAALSVARDAGGRLSPVAWYAIAHCLHMRTDPRPTWLGPWIVLLVKNAPEMASDWLEYALMASRWPGDRSAALLLFDHLTEPQAVFQRSYGLPGAPRFDVGIRGDTHSLREAWQAVFLPNLAQAAPDILVIVDHHLRRAHHLLTAAGDANPGWDPLSFSRAAIEPHAQDRYRESVDVLIDAARDCLQELLDRGDDRGPAYLNAWAASEVPLLRRLAVHGWVQRCDVDAPTKLAWLQDRRWLFDHQLRHEVFRLIETALPDADLGAVDALVAEVVAGPADALDEEQRDYETFNALAWMAEHAPNVASIHQAFDRARADHTNFEVRPHPDLGSWSETGSMRPQFPMTAEALHEMIEDDADGALAELRQYESGTSPFDGPTWNDAMGVLAQAVREWPETGFAILDAADTDDTDITRAVIEGWSAAPVGEDIAASIVDRLMHIELADVAYEIARMLGNGGQSEATPTEWNRVRASANLAAEVWAAIDSAPADSDVEDWLARAINNPAGWLAQFWVHSIAADWRDAGEDWSGLSAATGQQLQALLAGDDDKTALVEVMLASQVHFFFAADRDWCEHWLLPVLDWTDAKRAHRAWDGFLFWGRWNDQLLSAGLLAQYLETARHITEFRVELRRQLCHHLAAVAVSSEVDPIGSGWVGTFTTTVDAETRTEWMNQVAWMLKQLPSDAAEYQWKRWMRQYWHNRLESVPIQMTIDEASSMASWIVYLSESVPEGVALATEHLAGLTEHANLLHDLTPDRVAQHPGAFAALLSHLLRGTSVPFYGCYYLSPLVPLLRGKAASSDITAIVEQAVRLGCDDAPTW